MFFDRNIELEMRYFIRSIVDESDYDYIVLMARKMYSLYRSFQIDESQTPIITSDAILLYSEELSGKKVLVVDDILIHGRTVRNIVRLLKKIGVSEVGFRAFVISTEQAQSDKFDGVDRLNYTLKLQRWHWRKISRQIVNRLHETYTPLRSSCSHIRMTSSTGSSIQWRSLLGYIQDTIVVDRKDPEFTNMKTYLTSISFENEKTFINKVADRIYLQMDLNQLHPESAIIIPHVFLKPIHEDDMKNLFTSITGISDVDLTAQYQFVKYCISRWVARVTLKSVAGIQGIHASIDDSDALYYLPLTYREIVQRDDFLVKLEEAIEYSSIRKYNIGDNNGNVMEYIAKEAHRASFTFLRYICECGFADEVMHSKKYDNRIDGARISYITQILEMSFSDIIYMLTMSIASIVQKYSHNWLTERIVPGEQAFAFLLYERMNELLRLQDRMNLSACESQQVVSNSVSAEDQTCTADSLGFEIGIIINAIQKYSKDEKDVSFDELLLRTKYVDYMTDIDVYSFYESQGV